MKRAIDFSVALTLLVISLPLMLVVALIIKATSRGPALHWSKRVGKDNKYFFMPKFRSMNMNTPQVATDKLQESAENHITQIGKFIRKTSLDEIPQLYSILKGDMSFVGPRPALFNQHELVEMRTNKGIHCLQPGLTGWAQVNGRDRISDTEKVSLDHYYLKKRSLFFDFKIIILTILNVLGSKNVSH